MLCHAIYTLLLLVSGLLESSILAERDAEQTP